MKAIYREIAHPASPYCPRHTRLLPHPVVGWLTPAYPEKLPGFSVVLFRPNFTLFFEKDRMKVHKNQSFLTLPSPLNLPCRVTNQGTYHGVWWTDAFAVT
jgi:hypothetical protein